MQANESGPLTVILPRQPGSRESRYAHLLGVPPDLTATDTRTSEAAQSSASSITQRVAQMEAEIAALTSALDSLRNRVELLESSPERMFK